MAVRTAVHGILYTGLCEVIRPHKSVFFFWVFPKPGASAHIERVFCFACYFPPDMIF